MAELEGGDILFSLASFSGLHKKIARQQKRATETMKKERDKGERKYAGQDNDVHTKLSDEHIIHVGVCADGNTVVEVGGAGVYRRQPAGRENTDIVVRFISAKDRDKVKDIAKKIPELKFNYPISDVGIYTLSSGKNAPLVKTPGKLINLEILKIKVKNWNVQHGDEEQKLFSKFEDIMKSFNTSKKRKKLKELGKELEIKIKPFVCSHLVNAILHKAFFEKDISLIAALSIKEYFRISPAQMWRRFFFNEGLWALHRAKWIGTNERGKIIVDPIVKT